MGEEGKKEETKTEEKTEEKKEETKPPSPVVLFVDLHCVGCAKKIQKYILKIRGVEGAEIDMAKNEVTIKGAVEPQALCNRVMKKTKRRAKVLSPLPETEGGSVPEVVASQVSGLNTVELSVNMHCEACAQQLKRKILKMKGVTAAETALSSSKVMVTGTVDADELVDYVYRHTRKHAEIVRQPVPEKPPADEKPKADSEEKGEQNKEKAAAATADQESKAEEKKEKDETPQDEKKGGDGAGEKAAAEQGGDEGKSNENVEQSISMHKMMYYNNYNYQPLYMIDRIPAPQLFSDENPNACCIV